METDRTERITDLLERPIYLLIVLAIMLAISSDTNGQSWYANKYDKKGHIVQVNKKTVAQKIDKQQLKRNHHSGLYKIRRHFAHSRKRKSFSKYD